MTVISSEIKGEERKAAPLAPIAARLPWHAVGLVSLLTGFSFWLVGARFTVLGAPGLIALILGLFQIDVTIPLPAGWSMLILTIVVGAIASMVEFGCHPRRAFFSRSLLLGCALFLIWFAANAGDFSSTYIGVTTVQADSWPITQWIARTGSAAGVWTTFLTYIPELLMIGGWRWLIAGRF